MSSHLQGHSYRVLIRRGKREGQKGIVVHDCDDGTLRVEFPLSQGGGYETQYYLPDDVKVLGLEHVLQETEPFMTAFGPYRHWC